MRVVVLDTDAASAVLRRRLPPALSRELSTAVVAVSFVTVGELTKWTLVRHWGPQRLATLQAFPRCRPRAPLRHRRRSSLGELQAFAQLRGRPRPINDSWIAACCLVRDLPLATYNRKDYADFADHEGLRLLPV